ncbi:MAG: IS200/IS605 family transposase [Bacteroidota bacterium]
MANTYTQLHVQIVFAPKYRASLITSSWQEDLQKYITGIIQNNKHKMLCINCMPDHLHMLIGLNPVQSLSKLVQETKAGSSGWINKNRFTKGRFEWQEGYGAFSYSKCDIHSVMNYIEQQQIHHKKADFKSEYLKLLKEFEIEYKTEFVFADPI